jgi:predicted deacetylase
MSAQIGDTGTEQFTVSTRVNGELIKAQPIHDPFIRTTVRLRGIGHAWRALTKGICVEVAVDASHGATRAIMSLDPRALEDDTQLFLEQQMQRRSANDVAGVVGYYAEQK